MIVKLIFLNLKNLDANKYPRIFAMQGINDNDANNDNINNKY